MISTTTKISKIEDKDNFSKIELIKEFLVIDESLKEVDARYSNFADHTNGIRQLLRTGKYKEIKFKYNNIITSFLFTTSFQFKESVLEREKGEQEKVVNCYFNIPPELQHLFFDLFIMDPKQWISKVLIRHQMKFLTTLDQIKESSTVSKAYVRTPEGQVMATEFFRAHISSTTICLALN